MIERDPIVLAKEVASLDRISDGRVILDVGACRWLLDPRRIFGPGFGLEPI